MGDLFVPSNFSLMSTPTGQFGFFDLEKQLDKIYQLNDLGKPLVDFDFCDITMTLSRFSMVGKILSDMLHSFRTD